jgi:hypothetical protein
MRPVQKEDKPMFEIFWKIMPQREATEGTINDPLSHPDIERMSEREVADLPLYPRRTPRSADADVGRECLAGC